MTVEDAMADRRDSEKGFSLVETLMAAMLSLVVSAAVFTLLQPSNGLFASELESGDMQQRLRVAEGTLARSLMAAGAGVYAGRQSGPLVMYVPPVLPFREDARRRSGRHLRIRPRHHFVGPHDYGPDRPQSTASSR